MIRKIKTKLPLMFLGVMLLSACGGADTSALEVSQADIATQAAVLQQDIIQDADKPSEDEMPQGEEPTSNEPVGLPDVPRIDKGNLWFEPFNPIGVVLASGNLQIIEFSAHW